MARSLGNIWLRSAMRQAGVFEGKFITIWSAVRDTFPEFSEIEEGDIGCKDLEVFYESHPERAVELFEATMAIAQNAGKLRRHWERVLLIELSSLRIPLPSGVSHKDYFSRGIWRDDPILNEFLGRSPYERSPYLRNLWISNYRNFLFLLGVVMYRVEPDIWSWQMTKAQISKYLYGYDSVDSEVVNSWYKINKFGGH